MFKSLISIFLIFSASYVFAEDDCIDVNESLEALYSEGYNFQAKLGEDIHLLPRQNRNDRYASKIVNLKDGGTCNISTSSTRKGEDEYETIVIDKNTIRSLSYFTFDRAGGPKIKIRHNGQIIEVNGFVTLDDQVHIQCIKDGKEFNTIGALQELGVVISAEKFDRYGQKKTFKFCNEFDGKELRIKYQPQTSEADFGVDL